MSTHPSLRTFDSAATFTVFTIKQSETGLDLLAQTSRRAAQKLAADDVAAGLSTLQSLIENLYGFRKFVREVCSIFALPPGLVGDAQGNLAENADRFRNTLYALSDALEAHDTARLVYLLDVSLPEILLRFRDLMPVLRTHIAPNYPDAA